jgi:hypothetical protein
MGEKKKIKSGEEKKGPFSTETRYHFIQHIPLHIYTERETHIRGPVGPPPPVVPPVETPFPLISRIDVVVGA